MSGTLKALFEVEVHGVGFPRPVEFSTKHGIRAKLAHRNPAQLWLEVDGPEEVTARAEASRVAQKLYERFLLRFGTNIEYSVRPRLVSSDFSTATVESSATKSSPPVNSVSASITGNATLSAVASVDMSEADLVALVHEVEVRIVTPEVPTSAQLYTAIEMYVIGLEARNKVVRFLVLYSALAMAGLFKNHDGSQESVDKLLLAQNPTLPILPPPPSTRRRDETLYTKLRNDLIHAEERGCDPAGAMRAIEENVHDFQRDVALVLSKL